MGLGQDDYITHSPTTKDPLVTVCVIVIGSGNASFNSCSVRMENTHAENDTGLLKRGDIWTSDVIQRVITLGVIMTVTLVGNVAILLLLGCYSRYRKRHSRVNIFIINLAIGDLSVLVCTMVTEIIFVAFGDWILGNVACKLMTYTQIVTLAGTTFILTSMSFDRYLAICKPLSLGTTNSRARKMIFASWFAALIFAIPQLVIFGESTEGVYVDGTVKHNCKTVGYTAGWQRKMYFTFLTSYILVIPAMLISFCYINVVIVVWKQGRDNIASSIQENGIGLRRVVINKRSRAKIRTLKMTFVIIATFISCWTPYFVTTLIRVYTNNTYVIANSVMVFAETLAVLPSALNPILYGCFNIRLARSFTDTCYRKTITSPFKFKQKCSKHLGPTECMTVSMRTPVATTGNNLAIRQQEVKHLSNSSSGSCERNRTSGIIKEENMNGVKLRVRFTPKDGSCHSYSVSDEHDHLHVNSL